MADNKVQKFEKRKLSMDSELNDLLPEFRDLNDCFSPRNKSFLIDPGKTENKRRRRNTKIINTTPITAARTHRRGMTAGVASPARPWFRLRAPDPDLNRFKPVANWLYLVQQELEDMFSRSNFYNALGVCYGHQGIFGTLALGMFEDPQDDLRCTSYPIGSYRIAANSRGMVDTFYRSYRPTASQIVEQFVYQDARGLPLSRPDWSRVSGEVKTAYENKAGAETRFEVVHVVEPNYDRDPSYKDARNMPFRSCYYQPCKAAEGIVLKETGFEESPVKVARWEVDDDEAFGYGPGLEAMGDAKGLQQREKQKATRLDKHNDPALIGHPDLKNKRVSTISGDITYVGFTPNGGHPTLRSMYDVDPDISPLTADITEIERRINTVFDVDLFLMLSMSDAKDVTAEAVMRKHEEKVVMLGPVLERQNDELFDPAIDRGFAIALRRGRLPPPPEELEGSNLKVEYVSLLAQAQRMTGASTIDRMVGFIGGLAKVQADAGEAPDVFDKLDFDQTIDEYSEALGTMPTIIRSDDEVLARRQQRAEQKMQAQLAAAAKPVADVAKATKDLSQAEVGGQNVLERMTAPQ